MSSPTTDDYAGLMAPWKPLAGISMKNITGRHNKVKIDDDVKVRDLVSITQHQLSKLTFNRNES